MNTLAETVIGPGRSERVILIQTGLGWTVDVASAGFVTGKSHTTYEEALAVYLDAVQHMLSAERIRLDRSWTSS